MTTAPRARITIALDSELYEQIKALAKVERRSFASQLNWLAAEQLKQMSKVAV